MSLFSALDADAKVLVSLAIDAGVDPDLLAGGLVAFPANWLDTTDFLSVAMFSTFGQRTAEAIVRDGGGRDHVVLDRYYQQMWPASWSGSRGLYGRSGIDAGTPKVGLPSDSIRVRHRRVPAYLVRTPDDLEEIAEACGAIGGRRGRVLFRGQNRQFRLPRTPAAMKLLFGTERDVVEPSLLTSATRARRDGDRLLGLLQLELQDLILGRQDLSLEVERIVSEVLGEPERNPGVTPADPTGSSRWRRPGAGAQAREVLALAQHYAIPSYGLDMTENLVIATWFALHEAHETQPGRWWFRRFGWGGRSREDWPCVYFASINSLERERYELQDPEEIEALRPARQEAYMLHGGWGWHSNLSAELLVAVAYLHPDFAPMRLPTADDLFPGPSEDEFYDWLLRRRARAMADSDSPARELYEQVPIFQSP